MLNLLLVGLVILLLLLVIGPRLLSHDVAQWHVDPVTAPKPSSPNSYRAGAGPEPLFDRDVPVFRADASTLSSAWDRMIEKQPRVSVVADDRLAGSGTGMEGIVTYVQRSAFFGFPDYISVRFVAAGSFDDGSPASTLVVFSRSRLGESDLGVNEKRVNAWLAALETELG